MKLRLNERVRHSLADVLKKLADRGGTVFALLGWLADSGLILVGVSVWWLLCQTAAHLLLAIEDQ